MRKERIQEIEKLRGLAFLAVVFQHSIAHYAVEPGMSNADGVMMAFLLLLTKYAVPAFIFMTGMVLFYNDNGELKYGEFVKKRISDIYVPFAVWTVIHLYINHRLHLSTLAGWGDLGRMLLTGKASSHLWYIIMLFQLYLLYPLIRKGILFITRRLSRAVTVWLLAAAGLLFVLLTDRIPDITVRMGELNIPVVSSLFTDYADRNALYFMFYFLLGAAAGLNPDAWKLWVSRGRTYIWIVFCFLFGYLFMAVIQEITNTESGTITFYSLSLLRPIMAVFLVSSIMVMYDLSSWISRSCGRKANQVLNSIGLYSFGAYLIHLLTLRLSYMVDEAWLTGVPVLVRITSSWVISVLAAYGGARLMSQLPFSKWVAGVPNSRSRKRAKEAAIRKDQTEGF